MVKVLARRRRKEYTYYTRSLKARFHRFKAPWTYMCNAERLKPAFVRPKVMFKRSEYRKVRKGKVFGMTLWRATPKR